MKVVTKALIVLSVMLSGCAAMQAQYQAQVCNPETAYATGMNNARAGSPMDANYGFSCANDETKAPTLAAYRKGYTAGLESLRDHSPAPLIKVTIPGGARSSLGDNKKWHCKVSAFTEKYDAFGPTEIEARQKVASVCEAEYHPMHCDDISCERNL